MLARTTHAEVVEKAVTERAVGIKLPLQALDVHQKVDDVPVGEAIPECLGSCSASTWSDSVSMDRLVGLVKQGHGTAEALQVT